MPDILFNLSIRHLSAQVLHCDLLSYADNLTLIKVIYLQRMIGLFSAADELNAEEFTYGDESGSWNINFEPGKCHSLCVSLKDVDLHPSLFMDTLCITEVDVLKILVIHFDRKLTWSCIIDQLAARSCQRLGANFLARDYLGQSGLTIAFKSFVWPICEYSNIVSMGASAIHLHKLDSIQKMVEKLCGTTFSSLASRCNANSIDPLCKLLDLRCQGLLHKFCPILTSVTHAYSFCYHIMDDSFLLQRLVKCNSLDLFINSFSGHDSFYLGHHPIDFEGKRCY